ncbi:MAG TPA: FtsX-like permease family protein, partial [Terriglobia bacterium]|nr:FtsX-like permease family protein [Terriglobia bacterium]
QTGFGQDQDDTLLIPYTTAMTKLLSITHIPSAYVSATGSEETFAAQEASTRTVSALLAAVAGVSLIVGGIGIMNIMLVSVTERTREIGVRMAIGATEEDVQMQFLSEALVLSLIGGAVGILAGVVGSDAVSNMLRWPTTIPPEAIVIAVVFSAVVGVFFGYYPARKAASLDPIEALRYE